MRLTSAFPWILAVLTAAIVTAIPAAAQSVRDDAKKYIAYEWAASSEDCIKALYCVVHDRDPEKALRALENGVTPCKDTAEHVKQIYQQASKFDDPTGKTDSLWELVAKTAPQACDAPKKAPAEDPEDTANIACDGSYGLLKMLYGKNIPALQKVSELYQQKLYLDALLVLLYADPSGRTPYRACYAVKPDETTSKYRLFEEVLTVLGK